MGVKNPREENNEYLDWLNLCFSDKNYPDRLLNKLKEINTNAYNEIETFKKNPNYGLSEKETALGLNVGILAIYYDVSEILSDAAKGFKPDEVIREMLENFKNDPNYGKKEKTTAIQLNKRIFGDM